MERTNKMYLNVKDSESYKYDVIDLNNGERIPMVQEANDETGEFSCYLYNFGDGFLVKDNNDNPIIFKFKGNI
jgi:hypothetical protein